jgi:hypothetical protein
MFLAGIGMLSIFTIIVAILMFDWKELLVILYLTLAIILMVFGARP